MTGAAHKTGVHCRCGKHTHEQVVRHDKVIQDRIDDIVNRGAREHEELVAIFKSDKPPWQDV